MQSGDGLRFECRACGEAVEIPKTAKNGFAIIAYDGMVEWPAASDGVPPVNDCVWARAAAMPLKGVVHPAFVRFPFDFAVGERFWTLFMPALSCLNGWEEYPDEINVSAIVQCRFESIIEQGEDGAWVQLLVMDAIPLTALSERFPAVHCDKYLRGITENPLHAVFAHKEWVLHSWSVQGDCGEWGLLQRRGNAYHMVLYGEWGFHERNVHCGNIQVRVDA